LQPVKGQIDIDRLALPPDDNRGTRADCDDHATTQTRSVQGDRRVLLVGSQGAFALCTEIVASKMNDRLAFRRPRQRHLVGHAGGIPFGRPGAGGILQTESDRCLPDQIGRTGG